MGAEVSPIKEEGRDTRNGYEASKGSKGIYQASNRVSKGSRKTREALRGYGPSSGTPSPS